MSAPEVPVTDVEIIKSDLAEIKTLLSGHAEGINHIGANMQWLIDNVQGIFQMFSNPAFISQMTNTLMQNAGGINAGPGEPADPIPGVNVPGGF